MCGSETRLGYLLGFKWVVRSRLSFELTRGKQDRVVKKRADDVSRRVELGRDVAKGVIGDLVEYRAAFVQHQPHRIQVVGPLPVERLQGRVLIITATSLICSKLNCYLPSESRQDEFIGSNISS
jgi:precorrin-2 methylase